MAKLKVTVEVELQRLEDGNLWWVVPAGQRLVVTDIQASGTDLNEKERAEFERVDSNSAPPLFTLTEAGQKLDRMVVKLHNAIERIFKLTAQGRPQSRTELQLKAIKELSRGGDKIPRQMSLQNIAERLNTNKDTLKKQLKRDRQRGTK